MYTIRYEGGIGDAEKAAITEWVPTQLGKVVAQGVGVGDHLLTRWFGTSGSTKASTEKRVKMNDYINRQCQVITFVKKLKGAKVDSALVEDGDLAQVIRSCFSTDPSGFVPSGIRIYLLTGGFVNQDRNERFNTITHEISHRVLGTVDYVYGDKKALRLARNEPEKALNCAENWGYFYQELMQSLA